MVYVTVFLKNELMYQPYHVTRGRNHKWFCLQNLYLNHNLLLENCYTVVNLAFYRCECPEGFLGPRCQLTTRSFSSTGFAWFSPLQQCEDTHLSLEFITTSSDGLLLYNGPLHNPAPGEPSDFISVELDKGQPRLTINHGTGNLELMVKSTSLSDGKWHRLDIFSSSKV